MARDPGTIRQALERTASPTEPAQPKILWHQSGIHPQMQLWPATFDTCKPAQDWSQFRQFRAERKFCREQAPAVSKARKPWPGKLEGRKLICVETNADNPDGQPVCLLARWL
jgi:hypothetical protein